MADFQDKRFVPLLISYLVRTTIVTIVLAILLVFVLSAVHRAAPEALRPVAVFLRVNVPAEKSMAASEPDSRASGVEIAGAREERKPAERASDSPSVELESAVVNPVPEKRDIPSTKEASGSVLGMVADAVTQAGATASDAVVDFVQEKAQDFSTALANDPESAENSGMVVVAVPEELPPDPRAAKNEEPPYPWGLVVTNSYFYSADGTQKGILKGGTPVAYSSSQLHQYGRMYTVQPLLDGVWQSTPICMYEHDLILFPDVRYSESNREERDALIDFCTAYGLYEQERNDVIERMKARRNNPFESEYRAVKARSDKLQTEINEKLALYHKTDMEIDDRVLRGRLRQELEVLRGKQIDMKKQFDPISKKWTAWEEAHPVSYSHIPENAKMQTQRRVMQRLSPAVEKLVPGLTPTELR